MVTLQSPVCDVASLLFSSAEPDIGKAEYDHLINLYADQLVKAQQTLGVPESSMITKANVLREFNQRSLSAIMFCICTMPIRFQPEYDLSTEFYFRFFDRSERGAKFRSLMFSNEMVINCIKSLLRYADRSGYLS